MKTKEEIRNQVSKKNNFDSFAKAMRYCFNRQLLQSEKELMDKIIDEVMEEYAQQAIAEHEAEQWKPYPENYPEKNILKLVTCSDGSVKALHHDGLYWVNLLGHTITGILFWCDFPAPYQPKEVGQP